MHDKITVRAESIINRGEAYGEGLGMTNLLAHIANATQEAAKTAILRAKHANEDQKGDAEKHLDYEFRIQQVNWEGTNSRLSTLRQFSKRVVVSRNFMYVTNSTIALNAAVLMMNHHGISDAWLATNFLLETFCLLYFWLECILRVLGYGFGLYFHGNRLDFFVLISSSAGYVGSLVTILATFWGDNSGFEAVQGGLKSFTGIRLVKLLRALQMSRWIYDQPTIFALLETVFKSWKAMILISCFTVFSMIMFSVVGMQLLGGSLERYCEDLCSPLSPPFPKPCTTYNPDAVPKVQLSDYPRRNIETFLSAMLITFQYITAEGWSEIMFWYMHHNKLMPQFWTALFFVIQFVWLRCIMFSLFIAVLLVNFRVDEKDKIPRQRAKFERERILEAQTHKVHSQIMKAMSADGKADEEFTKKKEDTSVLGVLEEYNRLNPYERPGLGQPVDYRRTSLHYFDVSHPFRLFCAKLEMHPYFDRAVTILVSLSCFVIAFESPELLEKWGWVFNIFNGFMLFVFYVEMLIKMVVHGFRKESGPLSPYLISKTNQLDLFVIVVITLTYLFPLGGS